MIPTVVLASVLAVHGGGTADARLGRGVLGTTIAVPVQWVQVEEELATTFGVAAEQALTITTNVSVGVRAHGVRPYALVGAGRMIVFSAVDATAGVVWTAGGGVEVSHGHVGVRVDVRAVQGPVSFIRVATGLVVRSR